MSRDRLTKHIHDNYYTIDEKYASLAVMKLGKIEDIEEQIGTSLVEIATPKKPIKDQPSKIRYVQTYVCPSCGKSFSGEVSNFCYHCGQRLEWDYE